jgi:hypothetical protein
MNGAKVWMEPENVSRVGTRGSVVLPPACMLLGAVNDVWLGRCLINTIVLATLVISTENMRLVYVVVAVWR